MNDIEARLRDAYRGATDTVRPERIRGLGERTTVVAPSARWWAGGALHRLMVPLTAAAAVVLIGVVAAVVVPRALQDARDKAGNQTPGRVLAPAGDPATHFLVGLPAKGSASYLSIRSAITGAAVATVAAPPGLVFGPVATSDGSSYVVALSSTGQCGTRLRRFTISRTGQPSRLGTFWTRHLWPEQMKKLALSGNGRTLAFSATECRRPGVNADVSSGTAALGVIVATHISKMSFTSRGRFWPLPSQMVVNSLSLTADGRQLEFSTDLTRRFPSDVFMLRTDAPGGIAGEQRGRMIVKAARFGGQSAITSSAMTPDGRTAYFVTHTKGQDYWALRAVDVASGRSRLITEKPGFGVHIVASPSARELIAFVQVEPALQPSPVGTPAPSPSQPVPSASPSAVPSVVPSSPSELTPVPSASPTAVPSVSPSPSRPVPTSSPAPAPSRSPSETPVPSASPASAPLTAPTLDAAFEPFEVIRIQLPGGRVSYLNPVPWDLPGFIYVW